MDSCPPTSLSPPPLTSQMLGQPGAPAPQAPGIGSALAARRTMSALLVFLGKKDRKLQVAPRGNFISPPPSLHYSLPQRCQTPFQCISFPCPYLSLEDPVACSVSPVVLKHTWQEHHWQQKQQSVYKALSQIMLSGSATTTLRHELSATPWSELPVPHIY